MVALCGAVTGGLGLISFTRVAAYTPYPGYGAGGAVRWLAGGLGLISFTRVAA